MTIYMHMPLMYVPFPQNHLYTRLIIHSLIHTRKFPTLVAIIVTRTTHQNSIGRKSSGTFTLAKPCSSSSSLRGTSSISFTKVRNELDVILSLFSHSNILPI